MLFKNSMQESINQQSILSEKLGIPKQVDDHQVYIFNFKRKGLDSADYEIHRQKSNDFQAHDNK